MSDEPVSTTEVKKDVTQTAEHPVKTTEKIVDAPVKAWLKKVEKKRLKKSKKKVMVKTKDAIKSIVTHTPMSKAEITKKFDGTEYIIKKHNKKDADALLSYLKSCDRPASTLNRRQIIYAYKNMKSRSGHKGHATKRGLSQDQKLKSKEVHEKAYQKSLKKLQARHQNHDFTKIMRKKPEGGMEKLSDEEKAQMGESIRDRLQAKDIKCVVKNGKKFKITRFRLIKGRNLSYTGRKQPILNWNDWVTVNNTINDVLDEKYISAKISTLHGKFKVRDGMKRYTESDWEHLADENVGSVMEPVSRRDYGPRAN